MKNSNFPVIPEENLIDKIYTLRGQRVMMDRDLAILYGVKATRLREQVKRNKLRFPSNFMFQLNEEEVADMVSNFVIPSNKYFGGTLPYAFTEHGILMLANVLKSDEATQMSIRIIELFVRMREFVIANKKIFQQLEKLEAQVHAHNGDIKKIFSILRYLLAPDAKQ
jgi:hypothetical protein